VAGDERCDIHIPDFLSIGASCFFCYSTCPFVAAAICFARKISLFKILDSMASSVVESGIDEVQTEESLIIPIHSSELFIEIFPDELKEIPSSTILQVLKDEQAPLSKWADVGLKYMQQALPGESSAILQAACEQSTSHQLEKDEKSTLVRLLASAGIAHLAIPAGGEESRRQADQRFTSASKEDTFFPMNWMGQGFLNFRANRLDQARFFFDTTLKQCGRILPALIGMAAVVFGEGKFQQAQDLYGEALRLHPHQAGAAVRVGFGLASYQLGQVDRAKAAFQRALQLDPENVSAMVATAILTFASLDVSFPNYARETERAMKLMSMAHLLDHSNAMVQNHLANHYFYKWTPLPGTVSVQKGSVTVMPSQPIPLDAGESIRVGMHFETNVQDEANDDNSFIMKDAWTLESNGMLLCMKGAILDDSSILTFIDQTT
jgi:RNA polymerase-associated protein CTR9